MMTMCLLMINTFINNFKKSNPQAIEKAFTEGNCYWFAKILQTQFGGAIIYCPTKNHFAFLSKGKAYDITGEISKEGFENWPLYSRFEPIEAARIIKQCVNLEGIE